ncbi:hypothetical protein [Arthrobacter sp. KK5.5]|uniref:hypothetical protein n=1 Tax=Arthrobacter sp. KK5.5 TaxID=3373084 RepID=UPI003EE46105
MLGAAAARLSAVLAAVVGLPLILAAALAGGGAPATGASPTAPDLNAVVSVAADQPDYEDVRCPDGTPDPACAPANESSPTMPTVSPRPDSDSLWGARRHDGTAAELRGRGAAARAPNLVELSISRT